MEFEQIAPDGTKVPPPITQAQMKESFEPMQFAGSSIILPDSNYRVYTSPEDFKEVQASSAHEAMQKTDIRTPFKIQRHSLSRMAVLTQDLLSNTVQADDTVSEEVSADTAEAGETELPTEEKAMNEGLEGDEVDALLDGKEE